ncbi:MAG TPA: hypothetical protein VGH22_23015 [Candidatus Binatia bacterium]|jgi:hypothetical protein
MLLHFTSKQYRGICFAHGLASGIVFGTFRRLVLHGGAYERLVAPAVTIWLMAWQKVDRETANTNYDSAIRSFNDDGSLPEAGLRLIVDEAKKPQRSIVKSR